MKRTATIFLLLFLLAGSAGATDYYVSTTGNDANDGSSSGSAWRTLTHALQQVTGTAQNPAVLHVAAGTYNRASEGSFPIAIPASAGIVTISGAGIGSTIIDGSGAQSWEEYYLLEGNGPTSVSISDMTLTGGRGGVYLRNMNGNAELYDLEMGGWDFTGSAPDNPGLRVSSIGGDVIVQDVTMTSPQNDNNNGGGIRANTLTGTLILTRVTMTNPQSLYNHGGAVAAAAVGGINITDMELVTPRADNKGGGLFFFQVNGPVTINGLTATTPTSTYDKGGVIYAEQVSGPFFLSNLDATTCTAPNGGGAIYLTNMQGEVTLDSITIDGATSEYGHGGAIHIDNASGGVTLSSVDLNGTMAGNNGGAIYLDGIDNGVELDGITVNDSQSEWAHGGGIYLKDATGGTTFNNVSVTDAHTGNHGGGIYLDGLEGRLTLTGIAVEDCDTRDGWGGHGGGISITNVTNADSVIVSNLTLSNNAAGGDGGGLFMNLQSGGQTIPVRMDTVTVLGNSSGTYGDGGGFYIEQVGSFDLSNGTFENNQTSVPPAGYTQYDGGGIYLKKVDTVDVDNTAFIGNTARGDGGGMYVYDNTGGVNLQQVMFLDNVADGASAQESQGGGLHLDKVAEASIYQALFAGNYSEGEGGGIYWKRKESNSELELVNATMAFNESATSGSALYTDQNSETLINSCIIWGNGDTTRTATFTGDQSSVSGSSGNDPTNVTYAYSCVETDGGGTVSGTSNTNVNPYYYDPEADNFSVVPGSPVIDSGDPNNPFNFEPEPNGERVNMGWGMVISGSSAEGTSVPQVDPAPPSQSVKIVLKDKYIFMGSPIQPSEDDNQHIPQFAWGDDLNETTPDWEMQTWRFSRYAQNVPYGDGQSFTGYLRYGEAEANTGGVDVGDPPPITPGYGYWFVWNEGAVPDEIAVAVDIHRVMRTAEPYVLPLDSWDGETEPPYGYNMMANPWPFPIDWADVRFSTDQSTWYSPIDAAAEGLVSAYAGVWNHEEERYESYYGRLDPWQGFWVIVLTDQPVYMQFNPFEVEPTASTFALDELDEAVDWTLLLTARRTDALQTDLDNWIGVGADLSDEFDRFDSPELSPQAKEAIFLRTRLVSDGELGDRLTYDFRANDLDAVDYKAWYMEAWFMHDPSVPDAGAVYPVDVTIQWPTISTVPSDVEFRVYGYTSNTFSPETDPILVEDMRTTPEITLTLDDQQGSTFIRKRFWVVASENAGVLDIARNNVSELPQTSKLGTISPNPFNASTLVQFNLHQQSPVTLSVFNILGQKVTTLVQGSFEAGRHEVAWQADGFASGIYILRLDASAAGVVDTKKVVLSK
ncbi:T9SS type A sorting domain-containing protein [bacterium]|nr:T9SS type A sorting domain-containing protein [bacterium]